VVLLSAEDDIQDTIRPRLDAAGADVSRVVALQAVEVYSGDESPIRRCVDLQRDIERLEEAIEATPDCKLVVIDPITAYLGDKDSHNSGDVRGLLAPLADLAARHRVAVVMVTHLNKAAGGPAMYRSIGSISFVAAARSAWVVCKDESDEKRRLFLPLKNNLAENNGGLAFRLTKQLSANGQPSLVWDAEPVTMTADQALGNHRGSGGQREIDAVSEWLRTLLADGPVPATVAKAEAEDAGHSWATVRRAKDAIGVVVAKRGFGEGSQWAWALPGREDAQTVEGAQPVDVSTFAECERLRECHPNSSF
jgi:hypothetical protein